MHIPFANETMLGLRRVSFQIAFIGLGCRRRASVEKWWERSTGVAMDEEAMDIAGGRVGG